MIFRPGITTFSFPYLCYQHQIHRGRLKSSYCSLQLKSDIERSKTTLVTWNKQDVCGTKTLSTNIITVGVTPFFAVVTIGIFNGYWKSSKFYTILTKSYMISKQRCEIDGKRTNLCPYDPYWTQTFSLRYLLDATEISGSYKNSEYI